MGISYAMGTMDFLNKVTARPAVEAVEFDVVVRADSPYADGEAIKGKTVQTCIDTDKMYSAAKKSSCRTSWAWEYEMIEGLELLADGLLDGTYEIMFISEANYNSLCIDRETFSQDTKVIYQVKVGKGAG